MVFGENYEVCTPTLVCCINSKITLKNMSKINGKEKEEEEEGKGIVSQK